ncbi:MAG: hypothetical protein HN849_28425, partial [Victivallales bacterium]|nr:hypothetical protein [Victivallales bacterium]
MSLRNTRWPASARPLTTRLARCIRRVCCMALAGFVTGCATRGAKDVTPGEQSHPSGTRINIDPYCRRSIRGISELNRQAYFGLCDNGGTNFDARCKSAERYDWLIKENGITF